MPEGHSVHRLARQFGDVFAGERLAVSSPQGRFTQGAALLDGHTLIGAVAHGKHLFLEFEHGLRPARPPGPLRRLGLRRRRAASAARPASVRPARWGSGRSTTTAARPAEAYAGPPAPVGAVRVRLAGAHGWADLRGATTCAAITEAEAAAVLARLGPDPLRNLPGDRDSFAAAILARRTPLAALLMDQKVIAGVGNVYRAELLFRQGLDPWLPGKGLSAEAARRLWDDTVAMMSDGVRDGRIITTPPRYWSGSDGVVPGAGGSAGLCPPRRSPTSSTGGRASTAGTAEPRWP